MSYIVSWSGGKDCCYAYYKAIQEGYNITYLINLYFKRSSIQGFHKLDKKLIQLQAKSIEIPLIQRKTVWSNYENNLKKAVKKLIPRNIKGIIFGDIYIKEFKVQKHREWAERLCNEIGVELIEPLWNMDSEIFFLKFIKSGFEAIIIAVKADLIDNKWLGQKLNMDFLKYLKCKKIDPFGEKGEYHTFVIDGPIFNKKIKIKKTKSFQNNDYWFLDILEYS